VKQAFELAWATGAGWAEAALAEPLALLSDHAHCELGAAAAAQGMLARKPEADELVERLSAHALDELRHFKQVHRVLRDLGGSLEPVRVNAYAETLTSRCERGARNLLDRLLVAAVIERRSLERFELLAAAACERQPALAELYRELAPSEAGHAALFVELARDLFPAEDVPGRLARWIAFEGETIAHLAFAPRIHSGPLPAEERSR
jgi:tRNA-(ms[2]io[6]A)-hydroxylase